MPFLDDRSSSKGAVLSLLTAIIYVGFLINSPLFEIAKLKTSDIFQRIKIHLQSPPVQINDIVNVIVDDESIKRLNRPLDRALIASALEKLSEYKPKVIGLDISFVGESPNAQDDALLCEALRKSGNVILASFFNEKGEYVIPSRAFRDSALDYGLSHKPLDTDLLIRSATLTVFLEDENRWDYAFTLKVACKYLDIPLSNISIASAADKILLRYPPDSRHSNSYITIPLRENRDLLLNPLVSFNKFKAIPFWQIMEGESAAEDFKDKIVLVGLGSGFQNLLPTPFDVISREDLNAVEILMIITKNFIKEVPTEINMLIMALFYILTCVILLKLPSSCVFLSLFCVVAIIPVGGLLLLMNNYLLDFFNPLFIVLLTSITISSYRYTAILFENVRLKNLAITDGLTGLYLHRYFELKLQSEFRKAITNATHLSLVFIDIDHFKQINDTYGHENGNVILKKVAHILTKSSRRRDTVARYGGEEFTVILPHTFEEEAVRYAEKIRKSVEEFNFTTQDGRSLRVTLSAGVASYPKVKFASAEEIIKAADGALYNSKNWGRNRTSVYSATNDGG